MARTDYPSTFGAFVADPNDVRLNSGRQVDWANVPSSFAGDDGAKILPAGTVVSQHVSGKVAPRQSKTVTIARDGTTATATAVGHGYAVGDIVVISGANQAEYNGAQEVTAVTADTFDFEVSGSPDTPATGTITATISASGLLATSAHERSRTDSLSGYGVLIGGHVYENLLPDADDGALDAAIKTELGALFTFETYEDDRVPASED